MSPTPWRIALALAAGLALAACNSSQRQEREQVEQQLAAVEKELAALQSSLQALDKEKAALSTAVSEAESRHAEALTTLHRTQAAAAYLAELDPSPLPMSEELRMAREGWQLEQAVKGGDRQAVESAATLALRWQLPCEDQGEGEDESLSCDDYADACASVNKHLAPEPRWQCSLVPPAAEGASPAAFCVDTYEHPAPVGMEDSPYSVDDLPTTVSVARVATLENGELSALDYPSPDPRLYNPPNARERAECAIANQRSQCLVDCDKSHNRYTNPCAEDHYYEPSEEDEEEVDEEEQERQEAGFRECVATCESEHEAALEALNEPKGRASVSLRLESSPVPGVFLVTRQEKVLDAGGKLLREDSSLRVLSRPPISQPLDELKEVAALQEVPRKGQSLELVKLPGVEGPVLVGLSKGKAAGYAFSPKGEAVALEQESVCKAVRAEPKRWSAALVAACGPEPTPAQEEDTDAEPPQAGEDKAVVGEETP